MKRPSFFQLNNGSKASLPFTDNEYENRIKGLREIISQNDLDAVIDVAAVLSNQGASCFLGVVLVTRERLRETALKLTDYYRYR